MVKKLLVCGLGIALSGCFQPMKPSVGHMQDAAARPVHRDDPAAGAGGPRPAQAQADGARRNLQRRRQQRECPRAAVRARPRRESQRRHPPRDHRRGDAERDRSDVAPAPHPHRQAGRHAVRAERPEPARDARLAVPADLQDRLRQHGAVDAGHGQRLVRDRRPADRRRGRRAPAGAPRPAAGAPARTPRAWRSTNRSTNRFWETLTKNVEEILRETDKLLPGGAAPAAPVAAAPAAGAPGQPGAAGRLVQAA